VLWLNRAIEWRCKSAYSRRADTSEAKVKEVEMQRPAEMDIVRRAYEFWEQAGKPDGRDQEFYHQAERELQNEQAVIEQPR
jgi:RNA polymerase-interacting CarD/CdnL/TRCF family regulator